MKCQGLSRTMLAYYDVDVWQNRNLRRYIKDKEQLEVEEYVACHLCLFELCDVRVVEDDEHYLCKCILHNSVRQSLFVFFNENLDQL